MIIINSKYIRSNKKKAQNKYINIKLKINIIN